MENLNYSKKVIRSLLRESGIISTSEISALLKGRFKPDPLSKKQKLKMMFQLEKTGLKDPEYMISDFLDFVVILLWKN